jgi:hypothetical protein
MHLWDVAENPRLLLWARVREFAVPASMIEVAAARRAVGDWGGACAAARVDVDVDLRAVGRDHGRRIVAQLRADLRQLAPDLLRWHFPRVSPDGLLRPGLTVSLARYPSASGLHLVARTPPAWAQAGQRISLALWDPARPRAGIRGHPHPRPDRRFRLDLHRHLWDAHRCGELWERSGAAQWLAADRWPEPGNGAVHRWAAEAALLLRADGRPDGVVSVRLGTRRQLVLDLGAPGRPTARAPVLPDAATWVLPDLELLRAGLIDGDRLHPLVAAALSPADRPIGAAQRVGGSGGVRLVECRGERHRIGVVDGALVPLDHEPDEIRREELLVALGGPALPCLAAIDHDHRRPDDLGDIRARLDHGDTAGAVAAVEGLLGPDALLRDGPLRDELAAAARRRLAHGLYRAGLVRPGPPPSTQDIRRRVVRTRSGLTTFRHPLLRSAPAGHRPRANHK